MGIFQKFTSKIRSAFRARAIPPKLTPKQKLEQHFRALGGPSGHRGIAAGDLTPGKQDFSAENVAKWRSLSDEVGIGFVYNNELLFVHSSNLAAVQYFLDTEKMMIEFKNGAAYLFSNITEREAIEFFIAQSKGGWNWSNIRVRGKGNFFKTRKPFTKIRSGKAAKKPKTP